MNVGKKVVQPQGYFAFIPDGNLATAKLQFSPEIFPRQAEQKGWQAN